MTKVCPECKSTNDDSSQFCQNCGKKLEESVKKPENNKPQQSGGWWSKQSSGTKMAIILGSLVVVALILVAMAGVFSPNKTFTNTNNTNTLTYQGNGISFNYPTSWSVKTAENTTSNELVSLQRSVNGVSLLSISKESAGGHSLVYWMGIMQSPAKSSGNTLTSTKNVTVDGSPGYQINWKYTSNGGGEQQSTFFIKNDTLYSFLVTTDSISGIQSDLDTILNSFKVTS